MKTVSLGREIYDSYQLSQPFLVTVERLMGVFFLICCLNNAQK